jgi:hypothetical protein
MFSQETLSTLLYALATGDSDRAATLVSCSDELDDHERERLRSIIDEEASPVETTRRIGDALRAVDAPRDLSNECYRLAFYLSRASVALSENQLFAHFVANRSGPLLDKWIHYFPIYERHLGPYRNRDARLLEIGISSGGSLELWERYFGPSMTLVGIDIDEAVLVDNDPGRTIVIGDQADPEFLRAVVDQYGPFDVILDDGGHTMDQQITSVETLFPELNNDGVYIVEDCHTSYWEEYGGGLGRDRTFIEWIKSRVDDLHRYHLAGPVDPVWTLRVDAIHCYDSVVVLDKKERTPPFCEQMGSSSFVYRPRPASALVGEMLTTRNAAIEKLRGLENRVEQLEAELSDSRGQSAAMKRSAWWQITSPLRWIRRLVRER